MWSYRFSHLCSTTPTCDGQTDRQTDGRTDIHTMTANTVLAYRTVKTRKRYTNIIHDTLPLKGACRSDAIAQLKYFGASHLSWFKFAVGRYVNSALTVCAMDWQWSRILTVGENSGPILSRLWTEVHEIWDSVYRPSVVSQLVPVMIVYTVFHFKESPLNLPLY